MLVVVPFVDGMLHPATGRAVLESGFPHQLHQLDRSDYGAYARLFRQLWRRGEAFAICEQDVVPTPGQLRELRDCPAPWCSFLPTEGLYPDGPMFSLVKFSHWCMRDHPHAADDALILGNHRDREAGWWEVDSAMARNMEIRRVPWCLHDGRVDHRHVGPPSRPVGV